MRLLADIALFVEVANTRHFGRAAHALDIPASTLSRRISNLEKDLGVTLIHRSTRTFALTGAGAAFYEKSRKLIADATQIREEVTQNAGGLFGHVRIGLPHDLAETIFLPIFADFVRAHSGISIEIQTVQNHPNLLAETLDLAFLVEHQTALPDSSQWARRIGSFPRTLFASRQYARQRGFPNEPAELAGHDCILFSSRPVQKQWELRRGRERYTVDVRGPCSANSVGLLAQYAREHLGIAIVPAFLARHPAFGAGLIPVLPEWQAVPAHIFAITPTQLLPAKIRKLVDFVKAEFPARLAGLSST